MMSEELLSMLEHVVSSAVRVRGTFPQRLECTHRSFGDVHIITCADFWHLHQLSGTSFASNPMDESTGYAHPLLDIFRHSSKDSVRSLQALTELMLFLEQQCRVGVSGWQDYRLFHERTMLTLLAVWWGSQCG